MTPEFIYKDPDEIKILTFNWTRGLNTDATVTGTNTWSATPTGITFSEQTIVDGGLQTSAKASGGSAGTTYIVTNRVTTTDGETLEESGHLRVKESSST